MMKFINSVLHVMLVRVVRSGRVRCVKWVRDINRILVRKPKGKGTRRKHRYRWEDNIKIYPEESGW
jgi:hypothetical protein